MPAQTKNSPALFFLHIPLPSASTSQTHSSLPCGVQARARSCQQLRNTAGAAAGAEERTALRTSQLQNSHNTELGLPNRPQEPHKASSADSQTQELWLLRLPAIISCRISTLLPHLLLNSPSVSIW